MSVDKRKIIVVFATALVICVCVLIYVNSVAKESFVGGNPVNDTRDTLADAYARAVKDAEVAEASEIYQNLTPITDSNRNLIWLNESELRVLEITREFALLQAAGIACIAVGVFPGSTLVGVLNLASAAGAACVLVLLLKKPAKPAKK